MFIHCYVPCAVHILARDLGQNSEVLPPLFVVDPQTTVLWRGHVDLSVHLKKESIRTLAYLSYRPSIPSSGPGPTLDHCVIILSLFLLQLPGEAKPRRGPAGEDQVYPGIPCPGRRVHATG
jgi:hypothetical protein